MKRLTTSASSKELYALLGLPESATAEEIHAAFKNISRAHHPDVQGSNADFYEKIRHAHDVLMDPIKRNIYDSTGEDPDINGEFTKALTLLHMMLKHILESGDVDKNIHKELTNMLREENQQLHQAIKGGNKILIASKRLRKYMDTKWHGATKVKRVIITACECQIAEVTTGLEELKQKIKIVGLALTLMKDGSYDWEESPPISTFQISDINKIIEIGGIYIWPPK